ncbi:MAG: porin family protein [Beijerinckiaceae bacterium]|nr:porin family protein [Beijerinckiaceae bacterium]
MIRNVLLSSAALIAFSGLALAADLPSSRAPVAPPAIPAFSWTGVYVGGQIGYGFGQDEYNVAGFSSAFDSSGVVGGAHIGYNFSPSIASLVLGIEGDVNGSSERGSSTVLGFTGTGKSPVDGSIRGRAGVAFDRTLVYATGGAALTSFNYNNNFGYSNTNTRVGYTVGGGIEYAVTNEWSVRAEYRYSDFGRFTDTPAPGLSISHRETENLALAGFSYKFTTPLAPVVARY